MEWKTNKIFNKTKLFAYTRHPFCVTRRHHPRYRFPSLEITFEKFSIKFPNYSVKLLLLLFKPFEVLLILLLVVELLWLAFPFIALGLTTFCDTLGFRRILMRCCSVVSKPLRTSWLGIFFANNRRFTESSYVNKATMFWSRKPWQNSISFDALYTCALLERKVHWMWQMNYEFNLIFTFAWMYMATTLSISMISAQRASV